MAFTGYSLEIERRTGENVQAEWLPNSLSAYHKDRQETLLDTWGNVSQDRRVREPLNELGTETLQYTVPSEGWLHFLFDEIRMSDARNGRVTVTVKDSMGLTFVGHYDKERDVQGAIWPNQM